MYLNRYLKTTCVLFTDSRAGSYVRRGREKLLQCRPEGTYGRSGVKGLLYSVKSTGTFLQTTVWTVDIECPSPSMISVPHFYIFLDFLNPVINFLNGCYPKFDYMFKWYWHVSKIYEAFAFILEIWFCSKIEEVCWVFFFKYMPVYICNLPCVQNSEKHCTTHLSKHRPFFSTFLIIITQII